MLFLFLFLNIVFSQVEFEDPIDKGKIIDSALEEISGIDYSKQHNIIWCNNDSDGKPIIYGINLTGELVCELKLEGVKNRDWEDLSYGEIDGKYYIFVGDIGDNDKKYDSKFIYYFEEPSIITDEIIIKDVKQIEFNYPTDNFDSECLMFDHLSKDLVIITKREINEKVFAINYPYINDKLVTAEYKTEVQIGIKNNQLSRVTGGDISDDGKFILIKNYSTVFYWERGENLYSTINKIGQKISNYILAGEPQGESICWDSEINGFYTSSEKLLDITPALSYFKKKNDVNNISASELYVLDLDSKNYYFYDLLGNSYTYNDFINSNHKMFIVYNKLKSKTHKLIRHKN